MRGGELAMFHLLSLPPLYSLAIFCCRAMCCQEFPAPPCSPSLLPCSLETDALPAGEVSRSKV